MLNNVAGVMDPRSSAARMGWFSIMPSTVSLFLVHTGQMPFLVPNRRLRPSHGAKVKGRASWAGHYRRWGDNRMVPIPFGRGVPFRGDSLGGGVFVAQPNSA